jgi:superfamily II DNA/RNA helicase
MIQGSGYRKSSKIHVGTISTLRRKLKKLDAKIDEIIWDEAHLDLDFQKAVFEKWPDAYYTMFTATPERQDSRGLHESGGGICDDIVYGESIPALTAAGYLTPIRYYSPPTGTEGSIVDNSIRLLLEHAPGRPGKRVKPFCHFSVSVEQAYEDAEIYKKAGFNVECIEGKTNGKMRREIWDKLNAGLLDGITNRDLCTYGIDIPPLEVAIFARKTDSFSLYMQMGGRAIRTYHEAKTGYTKQFGIIFDMVNNIETHAQQVNVDGRPIPVWWQKEVHFNFYGKAKRKKGDLEEVDLQIFYCDRCKYNGYENPCPTCGADLRPQKAKRIQKELERKEEIRLSEIKPLPMKDMPFEARKETNDRVNAANQEWIKAREAGEIHEGAKKAVEDLLDINAYCGYKGYLWVYYKGSGRPESGDGKCIVDSMLIHEIRRQKNFKPGWAFFQKKTIEDTWIKKQKEKEEKERLEAEQKKEEIS